MTEFPQLARRGLDIVLISRSLSKLEQEAREIGERPATGKLWARWSGVKGAPDIPNLLLGAQGWIRDRGRGRGRA